MRPAFVVRVLLPFVLAFAFDPVPSAQISPPLSPPPSTWLPKLDPVLQRRAALLTGRSRVVVRAADGVSLAAVSQLIQLTGGILGRPLPIIGGYAADVPNPALPTLAASALTQHLSIDRVVAGAMERTGATVGATVVRQQLGYDGAGVGVAIVDSGVAPAHDDLTDPASGAQRVDRFVDLVNGGSAAYDDYGHGTHVAGIVAGNGFDSAGRRSGIAPGAHLISIKVLDGSGRGRMSDVIAALDYVVSHRDELHIRVVNLSIAAPVYESYTVDPLTVAAERTVRAGIVVVAAAGNNGRTAAGRDQYGGITAPGNAPWVLTVGASSHMGTIDRGDDTVAAFSSRGPSAVDHAAKPDLVAPGVGIESLSNPDSAFYSTKAAYLLRGTVDSPPFPYLSLSGTSMAAPVVAGTVALMLQANPALTPNEVKAILQYTAEDYPAYDPLTEGAGFLNAEGAVALARFSGDPATVPYPDASRWSGRVIWGQSLTQGGQLTPGANAWALTTHWGDNTTATGDTIVWGVICTASACDQPSAWSPWGAATAGENVVWGQACGGADCGGAWSPPNGGTADDTAVWSTSSVDDGDIVVWGTTCTDPSCQVIWDNP
jgi:serine protease AprX